MNENEINPMISALGEAGIDNVQKLTAVLKNAQDAKAGADVLKAANDDLLIAIKGLGENINAMATRNTEDMEAKALADAEAKLRADLGDASTDTQRKDAVAKAVEAYGSDIVDLALSGGFKKSLMAPVAKDERNADSIREFRKNHDLVLALTAANGGLVRRVGGKPEFSKSILADTIQTLEKLEVPGMNVYAKAAADAFDNATAGDGAEWLPTNMSRELVDAIFLPLAVSSQFRRIAMTSKAFDMPRIEGRARAVKMAQATSLSDYYTHLAEVNVPSSGKVTFTAEKLGITIPYSYEVDQDAIVPMGEMLLAALRDGLGASIEDAVLNGVDSAFNVLDNASAGNELWATTSLAQGRDMWSGIRRQVQLSSVTTVDGGTFTTASLRSARKEMGRYGVDPGKLLWVVSSASYNAILGLAEVITIDKYGPNATIVQGEIGRVDGIRIIVSDYVYATLASTGLYTGAGQVKTVAILVYVDAYAFGDRRMVTVEQDKSITAQQNILVGTWRGDFQKLQPAAEKTENVIRNIA